MEYLRKLDAELWFRETCPFPYFADRESAWLLSAQMRDTSRVSDIRGGPLGRFLNRPVLKPLVADCGGVLRVEDVEALADPGAAFDGADLSPAGWKALGDVYDRDWLDFELSFSRWPGEQECNCFWAQVSRPRQNLVVQLGFPSDQAALLAKTRSLASRKDFEYADHPVRLNGRPTLAWVRVDIEYDAREALIEEVQSDWLKFVGWRVSTLARQQRVRSSRAFRLLLEYQAALTRRYAKLWPKAALLAAMSVLHDRLDIKRFWMHQPEGGVLLKGIKGRAPPRSLYTDLPRSFGMEPVRTMPEWLKTANRKNFRRMQAGKAPFFWYLDLAGRSE